MLASLNRAMPLLLWLCCLAPVVAQDDAQFAREMSKLTPQLESATSGGHWSRSGEEGIFRLLIRTVGFEHVRNEAFLQWIRHSFEPDHPHTVERTVAMPELTGWRITGHRFVLHRTRWKIIVTAERDNVVDDTPRMHRKFFTVIPEPDYSYRVTESDVRPRI